MSRRQHKHILLAPIGEKQLEYAANSLAGKYGSKVNDDGYLLPQFINQEQKHFSKRIIPTR